MSFKEPHGQVVRWLECLQKYDNEIQHRPGKLYGNANCLSRRPWRPHGECPSYVPSVQPKLSAVTRKYSSGKRKVEQAWLSRKSVAAGVEETNY